MRLHPYARIALAALFFVLSATVVFSPSANQGGEPTSTAVTASTDAHPPAPGSDDRLEAIRILGRQ